MIVANVGKDVAKKWFDVCMLLGEEKYMRRFKNTPEGLCSCLKWLQSYKHVDQFNVVFEPTARYSELMAGFFVQQPKFVLYQVNTRKMSEYMDSIDFRVSDDQKAAEILALYAEERATRPERYGLRRYEPKSEIQLALRDVRLRLRGLYKRKSALENHLECGLVDARIISDTKEEVELLETQINRTLEYAKSIIDAHPQLQDDVRRLDTILGIAQKTAIALVCLVDFRKFDNSRALTVFLGLSNKRKTSGTSVRTKERITKAGSPEVRATLYFPAMSASCDNPQLREFAERLKAKGKIYPVIRTAVSRKLIVLAWTLIKKGTDYDPAYLGGPN